MTDDTLPTTAAGGPSAGRRRKQKGFLRKHFVLIGIGMVLAIIAGSAGGYWWWFNHQLSNIDRVHVAAIETPPQKNGGGEQNQPLNILLMGADNGQDTETVADDLKDGKWTPFIHRSDTLMVVHIPADRKSVQLISIPRDTWVPIEGYPYDDGHAKINAAFAYGGPSLAVQTVQKLTGMQIDHLAIIDWAGFKDLTTALGGVRVYIPDAFYDPSQRIQWTKGWQNLEGQQALAYVRTRYGLENGDFDRIKRQQNFLRATMQKLLSSTHNVVTMTKVINTITKYLTIDDSWDNSEIRNLGWALHNIHSGDVQFLTAPLGSYDTVDGQSIVRLNPHQSRKLFNSVDRDDLQNYLDQYPDTELGGDHTVH